jgi:hypothetical protein
MLLDNDVVGHREAEPCPFSGRFGGEEGIEYLFSYLGRDASPVVANSDFDCFTKISGGDGEDRLKCLVTRLALSPSRCIKAIRDQI